MLDELSGKSACVAWRVVRSVRVVRGVRAWRACVSGVRGVHGVRGVRVNHRLSTVKSHTAPYG